ncbi:unknown protein [Seminavis robusta]|uniref:Uncharacterized protein n=1 Tax=Seminavis robusta TaxID=568900 RepID=A0A9N8HZS6_9STRA|nr:unknown protein [Seminavis robusta]|eukprot:Sro3098_g343690.1 n/a (308) ;mRNA; r:5157-6080
MSARRDLTSALAAAAAKDADELVLETDSEEEPVDEHELILNSVGVKLTPKNSTPMSPIKKKAKVSPRSVWTKCKLGDLTSLLPLSGCNKKECECLKLVSFPHDQKRIRQFVVDLVVEQGEDVARAFLVACVFPDVTALKDPHRKNVKWHFKVPLIIGYDTSREQDFAVDYTLCRQSFLTLFGLHTSRFDGIRKDALVVHEEYMSHAWNQLTFKRWHDVHFFIADGWHYCCLEPEIYYGPGEIKDRVLGQKLLFEPLRKDQDVLESLSKYRRTEQAGDNEEEEEAEEEEEEAEAYGRVLVKSWNVEEV